MPATAERLTPDELVARWKDVVNKGTLANWRSSVPRRGPAYIKIGSRVLYPLAKVIEWEAANTLTNDNTEPGGKS